MSVFSQFSVSKCEFFIVSVNVYSFLTLCFSGNKIWHDLWKVVRVYRFITKKNNRQKHALLKSNPQYSWANTSERRKINHVHVLNDYHSVIRFCYYYLHHLGYYGEGREFTRWLTAHDNPISHLNSHCRVRAHTHTVTHTRALRRVPKRTAAGRSPLEGEWYKRRGFVGRDG